MAVARNILKNPKLLPGGGATELTVSAALKQKSSSIEGIEKVNDSSLASMDHSSINFRFDQLLRFFPFFFVWIKYSFK
jgi:hypothetical protein